MSNIKKPGILKREDIAALRYADTIRFATSHENRDFCSITCQKKYFDEYRNYHIVAPCSFSITKESNLPPKEINLLAEEAKVDFFNCTLDWELQTVFGQLQQFDELEVIWYPNIEHSLNKHEYVVERIKVIVYRKASRFHYVLGTFVSRFGSSMCSYKIVTGT